MPFPPFFRRLFGDNPVKPYKIRKELLPLDVDAVETFRKSLIGCLIPTTMATLPSCLCIPDGSLFLFEDYPELKEKYDAGGFNGMTLEANASAEDKAAWVGKWVKHPQGLGLYAPRLQGLFLRNGDVLGKYNGPGLPDATGMFRRIVMFDKTITATGVFSKTTSTAEGSSNVGSSGEKVAALQFELSSANDIFGSASTVMPASADFACCIYLGNPA